MKLISYILFSLLFISSTSLYAAGDFAGKVKKLVENGYFFYAHKKDIIYHLNGKERYKKVSFEELNRAKSFTLDPHPYDAEGIARDMIYFHKLGHQIILRKGRKFYIFEKGKLKNYDPLAHKYDDFAVKKIKTKTVEKAHCKYCTFKLSGNIVSIEGHKTQYNGEVAWLPYWRLTDTTGIRFSLGVSPYTIEDSSLKDVLSLGIKGQALLRQYIVNLFFEIGGGTHYFVEYQDFSSMATTGIGYTFSKKRWIINKKLSFSSIFFHASRVNWTRQINEAKFGVGFNF